MRYLWIKLHLIRNVALRKITIYIVNIGMSLEYCMVQGVL